ncbi:hypothetical protein C6B37_01280 [Candidatus Phytoplasma phoenicium]|uniref:Uncharacterized protein n=1 Tax=Candidatus Phytoplasma phoenicium TaxID=198422 RepID=A0A2S8NUS7_9MOLU|nr:hypothetical protein C6B37_01280 [Candidatus Phytoplasma phoenicium]
MEKQFLSNFTIVYQNKNIVFDEKEKKILVTNIDSFLNTNIYFAKSYFKILPGFLKMRDQVFLNFRIYFKFMKIQEKYVLKSFLKLVR